MNCKKCNYDGSDGWQEVQIGQDRVGNDYYGWACPKCGDLVCKGSDCGEDEFGQVLEDMPAEDEP